MTLHPSRLIPLAFLAALLLGTGLLMLPLSAVSGQATGFLQAIFTATSAVCVTGLAVVDTGTHWSLFGQAVILILIQIGGFGIMTTATLAGMLVSRRMGLSRAMIAKAETRSMALSDVVGVLKVVAVVSLTAEAVLALILGGRFYFTYDMALPQAAWSGLFHAISAFNNAGFGLHPDSLVRYAHDAFVLLPVMLAIVLAGIGFPVLHEMRNEWRTPAKWSIHARLTVIGTLFLLVGGTLITFAFEAGNPKTLGGQEGATAWLNAAFYSVVARTAGFNSIDIAALNPETLFVTNGLMLIGGGSAGTAGGIKVTTFLLLGLVVWSEVRGRPDTIAFGRTICPTVIRQALAVVLLAVGAISLATMGLLVVSSFSLDVLLFEAVSAFATVGLSTGITAQLPPSGQAILIGLMFVGRVGTVTVAAALALRGPQPMIRYPVERPLVG